MRASALVLVGMALALCIGVSACRSVAGPSDPQTQRGSVSREGQQVEREGATVISLTVPSCHGYPEVIDVEERSDRVLVEVVTTQVLSGDRMDCLDGVSIELERPLGDRAVIDAVSGSSLDVARELHLECFDADYPNDPTFDTPEEAFRDGLDSEAAEVDAPLILGRTNVGTAAWAPSSSRCAKAGSSTSSGGSHRMRTVGGA
jgi:hypothetical protein